MVTHGPPGDTFWDLIRKGAETAAKKDNIELKYSAELQGPDQANLVQNAVDSKVNAIAVTLARPEALKAACNRPLPRDSGGGVERRHQRLAGRGREGLLRPGREDLG
jgi:ABC-type sugar transport system, periplasmic component